MIITKKINNPVYTFIVFVDGRQEVIQVESNSKTNVLNYFFDYIDLNRVNLTLSSCHYFNNKGELKDIDLVEAYYRRKNRGVL